MMNCTRPENAETLSNRSTTRTVTFGYGVYIDVTCLSICDCEHDSCFVRRGDPWHDDCECPKDDGWMELRLISDGDWDTSRQLLLKADDMLETMERLMNVCRQVASENE